MPKTGSTGAGPPDGADALPALPEHPGWLLPLIGASIVALVVANNIGNAVWANWINNRPYGLLALNSSIKYLIGTTPRTDFWPMTVVVTLRLMAPDPLFWMIGHLYRDRAEHWGRRVYPGMGRIFNQFDEDSNAFSRVLDVLMLVVPNNPVCLLAGVAGMRLRRLLILSFVGTIGRIVVMRAIGFAFRRQINSLLGTVADYQKWFTIVSVVLVVGYVVWQVTGRRGLIGGVEELEDELGD